MSSILEQALKLPIAERRKLADDIYDSIAAEPDDLRLTNEQETETDRRIADYQEHPDKVVGWEEVRERLRKIA